MIEQNTDDTDSLDNSDFETTPHKDFDLSAINLVDDIEADFDIDDIYEEESQDNLHANVFEDPSLMKRALSNTTPSLVDDFLQRLSTQIDPEKTKEAASWKPLPGPQSKAFYSKADEIFYGGAAGGGKLLSNNILIPNIQGSYKRADKIKIGDQLISSDGGATRVLAVYPHKGIELYKFTFIDGAEIVTGADHIWLHWFASKKIKAQRTYTLYSPEKGLHEEPVRGRLALTKDLYEYHLKQEEAVKNGKRPYWVIIPLTKPVRYTYPVNRYDKPNLIDPYFLGLLLGDGYIPEKGTIQITTIDDEILDWVRNFWGHDRTYWDNKKHIGINDSKELKEKLRHWKLLGTKSNSKFIPKPYLLSSVENRYALMEGLFDTDGYVDSRGHLIYTTVSPQLAKDVRQLAMSLGAKATITEKEAGYKDDEGNFVECQLAYNVYIQGDNLDKFVRLDRKKKRCKPFNGGASESGRRLISVEKLENGDGVCFAVDHPSGLHLATEDFIVTHNTDLMVGLSVSELSKHKKAIVFRSTFPEHRDFIKRVNEVMEDAGGKFKAGARMEFDGLPGGKSLELGSVSHFSAAQKYRGRPHDLKMFDEVCKIPEIVYTFLIGWARTTDPDVPVRVIAAGNPPMNSDEAWVIRRWRPWLDSNHPNPAESGELRWFATLDGEDTEITVDVSEEGSKGRVFPFVSKEQREELIKPKSRTFIRASLDDNPYLAATDYRSQLQNLPEPYRSQLLYGDFTLVYKEDPWQVVSSEWVRLATDRYQVAESENDLQKMARTNIAYGLDVGEAGDDPTVLIRLGGNYIQEIITINESDPKKQADLINKELLRFKGSTIGIDFIGPGLAVGSHLREFGHKVVAIKGSRSSKRRDKTGTYGFANLRAELYWRAREALSPNQELPFAIPKHVKLREELTSIKYKINARAQVVVEPKINLRKKLGRSPDYSDAFVYALYAQKVTKTPLRMI